MSDDGERTFLRTYRLLQVIELLASILATLVWLWHALGR